MPADPANLQDMAAANSLTGASICTTYHLLFMVGCAVALFNAWQTTCSSPDFGTAAVALIYQSMH
jgi:hypothetical protein